ncbi:MAG: penicillin-binding protein 1C [Candidatus Aminicenantes bacterium]|nr:penicillin-binding protein 1C [Candidatus Aminicenantes bacterium]
MRKRTRRLLILIPAVTVLAAWGSLYLPFPKSRLNPAPILSFEILDRNGALLREVLSDEGGRCRWIGLEEVSPLLLKATLASEDKAFFSHSGIDPLAILRALAQNLRARRTVSGASTVTQQLVRNIYGGRRTLARKLFEAWMAVRLEHTLSKEEILVQYLNRIPYGNQAFGIEAASRLYFDKPAEHLSLAESAFLAGIPRAPTHLNPYRRPDEAVKRQREILRAMESMRLVSPEEAERALNEKLVLVPSSLRFRAPHFCDFVLSRLDRRSRARAHRVRTTLDYALQSKVETQVENQLARLSSKAITHAAVVVLDNETDEILSLVGSRNFFDDSNQGQVNGALALRQPGSALKPFTYALALEQKFTAATLIDDSPEGFPTPTGTYRPRNYDRTYHGLVRLRVALACSYNVPAVALMSSLGEDRLFRRLKDLEFDSLSREASHYGLGLTLGNGEVSLLELARGYAALARGGIYRREKIFLRLEDRDGAPLSAAGDAPPSRRVFSERIAFLITHILSDRDARVPAFGYLTPLTLPFPAAAKTGTSKDYRDNWTVGYTPRHTVAVWVGNFDGRPMQGVSGITGCGPLFHDVMLLLSGNGDGLEFPEPPGIVRKHICPQSGLLPGEHCPGFIEEVFIEGTEPKDYCLLSHKANASPGFDLREARGRAGPGGVQIVFPCDGDVFKIDPVLRPEFQTLRLRARVVGGNEATAVEWWINGRLAGRSAKPFVLPWPLRPGSYIIKAMASTAGGKRESREVRIVVLP